MRQYAGPEDLQRIAQFLTQARAAVGHCGYYHLGDLSWNLFLAQLRGEIPENLRLWEDRAGELLGFAWYYPPDAVDLQTAPWHPHRAGLQAEMLDWALARRREFGGENAELSVEAFENDARFLSVLEDFGFRRGPEHKLHMLWDLSEPIPAVVLPGGFTIRTVSGDDDVPGRETVQKAVWPWSRLTAEAYPALRSMPGYHPELDLVCVAPDGRFAAFALCWLDAVNRVGEFEPVGTHPELRGKGLAKALLWEGLRRLYALGATAALVYPPGGDLPAERLYTSAGFRPLQRQFNYSRAL